MTHEFHCYFGLGGELVVLDGLEYGFLHWAKEGRVVPLSYFWLAP